MFNYKQVVYVIQSFTYCTIFVVVSYFFVVQLLQAQSPHPSFVVPGNVLELSVVVFCIIFVQFNVYNYLNLIIVIFRK